MFRADHKSSVHQSEDQIDFPLGGAKRTLAYRYWTEKVSFVYTEVTNSEFNIPNYKHKF